MVQLKYFGDNRDFFKYDLITFLFEKSSLNNYVFVPMLTYHRNDNEGNIQPQNNNGDKSKELLDFIIKSQIERKSLTHWEKWLRPYVSKYATKEPVDETYFPQETREQYWEHFKSLLQTKNALIFVDPDTGLETGKPSYLKKMGLEKYILNHELKNIISMLHTNSVLMIYQHLTRNRKQHLSSVGKKLQQIHSVNDKVFACAYRESDLVFLFATKSSNVNMEICRILNEYHKRSAHKFKSIHPDVHTMQLHGK